MERLHFEIKDRAEELLKAAIEVWRANYKLEDIEGIEKDPVFMLFLIALAYQEGEIKSGWDESKRSIYEDFFEYLCPLPSRTVMPYCMIIKSTPRKNLDAVELNFSDLFKIHGSDYHFIPLFKTRVLAHTVKSVIRLDGRRWKVSLAFNEPVKSLEGFAFQILNTNFQDLVVSYKKEPLAIVKPWEVSDLPFVDCLSFNSMLYQQSQSIDTRSLWFDLFSEQNVRLFVFKKNEIFENLEEENIDLIFEFTSINNDFSFNKDCIVFNTFPIVNISVESVDLSANNPIRRIEDRGGTGGGQKGFLCLIPDNSGYNLYNSSVVVRKFDVDRFGLHDVLNLANELVQKFSSDFYAFQSIPNLREGGRIKELSLLLDKIKDDLKDNMIDNLYDESFSKGIYLILRHARDLEPDTSVNVKYLVSNGEIDFDFIANRLNQLSVPANLNAVETQIVQFPHSSYDIKNKREYDVLQTKYLLATSDRLVTSADIKLFCYKELYMRYFIPSDYILNIDIKHRLKIEPLYKGYEIAIFINLTNNSYVQKKLADNILHLELLLQKMIENRMPGIYPVVVAINLE
ncbi:hypothetical protein [Parabacteroides sp.]